MVPTAADTLVIVDPVRFRTAPFAELERPATTARTDASAAPFDLIARDLDPDLDLAIPAVDNPTTTN